MPLLHRALLSVLVVAALALPTEAARRHSHSQRAQPALSLDAVNGAELRGSERSSPSLLLRVQVLLDRAHFSPGEIDANFGENTRKAIRVFRETQGLGGGDRIDEATWRALVDKDNDPALMTYRITEEDTAGPFVPSIPKDFRAMAEMKHLSYTSPLELLGEKFHMSEALLRRLNPGAAFDRPGTEIIVANVQRDSLPRKIARVAVDATEQRVLAYDRDDQLVAAYPATVGSSERPSPEGNMKVTRVAYDPTYHYDPSLNFKGVHTNEPLDLPPGPNNPVGLVWIALSAKGYGIHGTPDPSAISKRASHGCIRLTNWDALELAHHVSKGTPVNIAGRRAMANR